MKAFVCEAVQLLGGRVEEGPDGTLRIQASPGSEALELLEGAAENRVALDREGAPAEVPVISPGHPFLDDLAQALALPGRSRHGVLSPQVGFSRKEARDRLQVFAGELVRFSARKAWRAAVRIWVKAAIQADDVNEHLFAVEVADNGPSRVLETAPDPDPAIRWRKTPPVAFAAFEALVERAMKRAEQEAVRLSEEAKQSGLERLHQTLDRLERYYDQLREEALSAGKERAAAGAEAEHERRKADEIEGARVRARVDLVALETVSTPVKRLEWALERGGIERQVIGDVELLGGAVTLEQACEVCGRSSSELGLGLDGTLFCPDCGTTCSVCGKELIGPGAQTAFACASTGEAVCDEHAASCETCKVRVRSDLVLRCRSGCAVCPNCARSCPDCGEGTVWCPEHVHTNAQGESVCPSHAFTCHACGEPFPLSRAVQCASCGVTLCGDCSTRCAGCGRPFCTGHLLEGKCFPCRQEVKKWKSSFQRSLF